MSSPYLRTISQVFIITDNPALADGLDPNPLVIPRNGPLTALTGVLPLQVKEKQKKCTQKMLIGIFLLHLFDSSPISGSHPRPHTFSPSL